MIFHLGFELPEAVPSVLEPGSAHLNAAEIKILKEQIRKNATVLNDYVSRLDLFLNRERYPRRAVFIEKIRRRLYLLMEENDTFRKVLWIYYRRQELVKMLK